MGLRAVDCDGCGCAQREKPSSSRGPRCGAPRRSIVAAGEGGDAVSAPFLDVGYRAAMSPGLASAPCGRRGLPPGVVPLRDVGGATVPELKSDERFWTYGF